VAILSKPTINKVIESIRITVNIAMPGYVNITIDSIIEIAPRPICTERNQLGDFTSLSDITAVN
jgi:hypothetical protein